MVDSKAKDRLAEALRRAEAAIQKTTQAQTAEDEGVGSELDLPEESPSAYTPGTDFGAVELEQSGGALELGDQPGEKPSPRPVQDPVYVRQQPQPNPQRPQPQRKKPKMPPAFTLRMPTEKPLRKSFPLKFVVLIIGIVGILGASVIGYLVWQQSLENEKLAQLKALDQASIETMKTEAAKKEQLGTP